MSAYDPGAWHDFFVTAGTAAAALTGLLFVAFQYTWTGFSVSPSIASERVETSSA